MSDFDVLIDSWIQPAGSVDTAAVLQAIERELARLVDTGRIDLPNVGGLDISRLRVDGASLAQSRVGDADALGLALARAIVAALPGGRP